MMTLIPITAEIRSFSSYHLPQSGSLNETEKPRQKMWDATFLIEAEPSLITIFTYYTKTTQLELKNNS